MCKWNKDEFCTNDESPYCADYCPVAQDDRICKYREANVMSTTDEECEQQIRRYIGGLPKGTQKDIWDYINSLKERIEDGQVVKLYTLKMQGGEIDMSLESKQCKLFLATLIQIFDQNGGKDFFTVSVEFDDRKGARYALTIQKIGGKTPADELSELRAESSKIEKQTAQDILSLVCDYKTSYAKCSEEMYKYFTFLRDTICKKYNLEVIK